MVVLFLDGFILLTYKSLGKKEIVNKLHQSCLCPFKTLKSIHNFFIFYIRVDCKQGLSAALGHIISVTLDDIKLISEQIRNHNSWNLSTMLALLLE